ncbi:pimeloyl-ACP methyl ester carboxylesterase [Sinobacterium caligoides]|uniref:Pimeloyl-ACP methyl ester carboxylesterase n=1 Tax=Sinobacterium caligoides TaxID=933926 RepID=A0A3N2DPQ9_9GAMM|nr:alpha/beta hydrolase [Sinobacterium caligoides]ROS01787.1 pimeloyl-ACP methyl ester carboxylesterase [Sinobacterium caligoides]
MKNKSSRLLCAVVLGFLSLCASAKDLTNVDDVEHHYTENEGVKLHYAAMGQGPLVVFLHGWPDYWYSWIAQMNGLKKQYRVVALDTRGYNESDQPEAAEDYDLAVLAADVEVIIRAEGRESATIVGHDWGGAIAWYFAMTRPSLTDSLVVVNFPHPLGIAREVAKGEEQYNMLDYARSFTHPQSHLSLSTDLLLTIVDPNGEKESQYRAAFDRSSFNGMMNYYRQNLPKISKEFFQDLDNVQVPVLQVHGLEDIALHPGGLDGTWQWLDNNYTLLTLPQTGHWSHHEEAETVNKAMKKWLRQYGPRR